VNCSFIYSHDEITVDVHRF